MNENVDKKEHLVRFHGKGSSVLLLTLKNIVLRLLTLGIYSAWAKTEKRKYYWQNIEVGGNRLFYTGTGMEIFKGYLKILAAYFGLVFLFVLSSKISIIAVALVEMVFAFGIMILTPYLIFWSRQ